MGVLLYGPVNDSFNKTCVFVLGVGVGGRERGEWCWRVNGGLRGGLGVGLRGQSRSEART